MLGRELGQQLLSGLLAWERGWVRQDQLVSALRMWLADGTVSLLEILGQQCGLSATDQKTLETMLEHHAGVSERSHEINAVSISVDDSEVVAAHDIDPTLAVRTADGASSVGISTNRSRYQVQRLHARGGLGEVFLAKDLELHRDVALKEIQARFAQDLSSQRRFLIEAEITGRLEHPGIVPVYGLGRYPDGRPYYAMRFIQGDSLQQAVDRFHSAAMNHAATAPETAKQPDQETVEGLTHPATRATREPHSQRARRDGNRFTQVEFRQLLGRFVDVCQAIDYAHSRGVLHRDLKPSNIMLGRYGETLVVDWGLAKTRSAATLSAALDPDDSSPANEMQLELALARGGAATMAGATMGTPAYMSPEQASGKIDQLGPASDVYSLGATLYYLLVGKAPFSGKSTREVLDRVRAGDFVRPRQIQPAIPKGLEAICLKAMALSPQDRYASAGEIAAEIERDLADEPVQALVEPVSLRARRWIRKHPKLIAGLAATLFVGLFSASLISFLIAGQNRELANKNQEITGKNRELASKNQEITDKNRELAAMNDEITKKNLALEQANEAERLAKEEAVARRKESEAVLMFFQTRVLAAARPKGQQGGLGIDATIRDAVNAAEPAIAGSFAGQPLAEAWIRTTMGLTYSYLGLADQAIVQHQRARDLRVANLGVDDFDSLVSMNNLAVAHLKVGDFAKALPLLQETLERRRKTLGAEHPETLNSLNNLGATYQNLNQMDKALPLLKESLEIREELLGADHPDTLQSLHNLGIAFNSADRVDEAYPLLERAFERRQAVLGMKHPDTLLTARGLATAYRAKGEIAKALPLMEEVLSSMSEVVGEKHPETLVCRSELATIYMATKDFPRAISLLDETLQIANEVLGATHPTTLRFTNYLATCYFEAKEFEQALSLFETSMKLHQMLYGVEHLRTLGEMRNLAEVYVIAGQSEKAVTLLEEVVKIMEKKFGAEHPETRLIRMRIAEVRAGE